LPLRLLLTQARSDYFLNIFLAATLALIPRDCSISNRLLCPVRSSSIRLAKAWYWEGIITRLARLSTKPYSDILPPDNITQSRSSKSQIGLKHRRNLASQRGSLIPVAVRKSVFNRNELRRITSIQTGVGDERIRFVVKKNYIQRGKVNPVECNVDSYQ